jgi:ankyrin repeat protein
MGCSALHFAAAVGKQRCIKLLLEAGADTGMTDKDGALGQPGISMIDKCVSQSQPLHLVTL